MAPRTATAFDEEGSAGQAARAILRPEPFTEILVEIDWVRGREPTQDARDHLARSLQRVTGKKVTFAGGNEIPARGSNWPFAEIKKLGRTRTMTRTATRVVIYIAYLDKATETGGIGVAVGATVASIHPDGFRNRRAGDVVQPTALEATAILHEVGHLVSLVGIGYHSPRDHRQDYESPTGPHHSKNRESVMYWTAETTGIADLVRGAPLDFDADDLGDLRDIAEGRL